jgi:hypothetical protein
MVVCMVLAMATTTAMAQVQLQVPARQKAEQGQVVVRMVRAFQEYAQVPLAGHYTHQELTNAVITQEAQQAAVLQIHSAVQAITYPQPSPAEVECFHALLNLHLLPVRCAEIV